MITDKQVEAARIDLCERICAAIKAADDKSSVEADYMLDSNDCIRIVREQFAAEAAREPADYPNPGAHTPLRPAVPSQTPAAQGEAVPVYQWRSRGNGSPFQDNSWYDCSAAYYRNLGEDGFERRILYRLSSAHDLYKKGDADAPAEIRDRNDDVVLCLCRRCGKAEAELDTPCTPPPSAPGVVSDAMVRAALAEADRIRIVEKTGEETRLSVMREVLVAALNAAAQPSADDAPPVDENGAVHTGDVAADRIINRLNSSDPDFDDCADAVAWIYRAASDRPDGFTSWKDAAIHERARRVEMERAAPPADARDAECPNCKGSGEMAVLVGGGPDAYETPVNCPKCAGTGAQGGAQ